MGGWTIINGRGRQAEGEAKRGRLGGWAVINGRGGQLEEGAKRGEADLPTLLGRAGTRLTA
jgi:hypothetical protein